MKERKPTERYLLRHVPGELFTMANPERNAVQVLEEQVSGQCIEETDGHL